MSTTVDAAPVYKVSDLPARIAAKIRIDTESGCWVWTAMTTNGYAYVWWWGQTVVAHRVIYKILVGGIPVGLHLDHTCHKPEQCRVPAADCPHKRCVNPAHLEPTTVQENVRRSVRIMDRCRKGLHDFTLANTGFADGHRYCRACERTRAEGAPSGP